MSKKAEVSVILRRQVPIRFDEPARSWLGGLPQMPDNIRWPRTASTGAPLHFIAQIACADLPKQIWNGRGPRDGWLLLFVDVLQMEDFSEEDEDIDDARRCLLVLSGGARLLGLAATLPSISSGADLSRCCISTVSGRAAAAGRHDHGSSRHGRLYRPVQAGVRDGVPKLWRRWPVDVVVQEVPPPPSEDSGTEWEPLQVTGADLYGAPEDDETHRSV